MWALNYFLIGIFFTFMVDLFLDKAQNHPKVKNALEDWNNEQRIACIIIWPIGILWFLLAFIKNCFK